MHLLSSWKPAHALQVPAAHSPLPPLSRLHTTPVAQAVSVGGVASAEGRSGPLSTPMSTRPSSGTSCPPSGIHVPVHRPIVPSARQIQEPPHPSLRITASPKV